MPFIPKHSRESIKARLQREMQKREQMLTRRLAYIGEMAINATRGHVQGRDYTDRTGNLRSSIGYLVVVNGQVVAQGGFDAHASASEGKTEGRGLAEQIAQKQRGIALIVVAGMNYATHVHHMGYDVLDSSRLTAEKALKQLVAQLSRPQR